MKTLFGKIIKFIVVFLSALFILYPLFFSVITALKSKEAYIESPLGVSLDSMSLDNFIKITNNFDFVHKMGNSAFVVITSLIIIFAFSIPAAFYLCNMKSRVAKHFLTIICFSFMFIPEEVLILPEYNLMSKLGLINNFLSVIIIFVAVSLPECIYLLYMYFSLVPNTIINAARSDGATELQCLKRLVVPICKGPILVVLFTTGIALWNSFLIPMLMLHDEDKKLLLPSLSGLITKHSTTPTYQMAGLLLSMVPLVLVYFIFRRHIYEISINGSIH